MANELKENSAPDMIIGDSEILKLPVLFQTLTIESNTRNTKDSNSNTLTKAVKKQFYKHTITGIRLGQND